MRRKQAIAFNSQVLTIKMRRKQCDTCTNTCKPTREQRRMEFDGKITSWLKSTGRISNSTRSKSKSEYNWYKRIFDMLDEDGNGTLDVDELCVAFELIGLKVRKEDLQQEVYNISKKDYVNLGGFLTLMDSGVQKRANEKTIQRRRIRQKQRETRFKKRKEAYENALKELREQNRLAKISVRSAFIETSFKTAEMETNVENQKKLRKSVSIDNRKKLILRFHTAPYKLLEFAKDDTKFTRMKPFAKDDSKIARMKPSPPKRVSRGRTYSLSRGSLAGADGIDLKSEEDLMELINLTYVKRKKELDDAYEQEIDADKEDDDDGNQRMPFHLWIPAYQRKQNIEAIMQGTVTTVDETGEPNIKLPYSFEDVARSYTQGDSKAHEIPTKTNSPKCTCGLEKYPIKLFQIQEQLERKKPGHKIDEAAISSSNRKPSILNT